MRKNIIVLTDREDEDFTWLFAWCLAGQSMEDFEYYDIEYENRVMVTDGVADEPFRTFILINDDSICKRALAFTYEWSLLGYEPAQRCMQAFYRAMLGVEEAVCKS